MRTPTNPHPTNPYRDRVLSGPEIRAFWHGCEEIGRPYGTIGQSMLSAACRLNEAAYMRRVEVDYAERVWTLTPTMSHRQWVTPLTDFMMTIVGPAANDNEFVFTTEKGTAVTKAGLIRARRKLHDLMRAHLQKEGHLGEDEDLAPWVFHDIRRTAFANFCRLGFAKEMAEQLLHHAPGDIHARLSEPRLDDCRKALETWNAEIARIIAKKQ